MTNHAEDLKFLQIAVEQMQKSVELGGFPAGAIVVKDGDVIAHGVSLGALLYDPTSHSETASIRKACAELKMTDLADATLYASLQPCLMCFSVANWAGISRIVFGLQKTSEMIERGYYEGTINIIEVNKINSRSIELKHVPDFESDILGIINKWQAQ